MGCQALSDSQTFIFLVALITHESLSGLGEMKELSTTCGHRKNGARERWEGNHRKARFSVFLWSETPRKRLLHRLLLIKLLTPAQYTGKKHDLEKCDPQLPRGLMCTDDENTLIQLLVPWQESLVGFSNVSSWSIPRFDSWSRYER